MIEDTGSVSAGLVCALSPHTLHCKVCSLNVTSAKDHGKSKVAKCVKNPNELNN